MDHPMNWPPLHSGAVHEAGHAVMARYLGVALGHVRIDLADPLGNGRTCVHWTDATLTPENEIRVLAASRASLLAFGVDTELDYGLIVDHDRINEIAADKIFPDDQAAQARYIEAVDAEVEEYFSQPNVRAAVEGLVAALTRSGEIDGDEAMAIIDRHLEPISE